MTQSLAFPMFKRLFLFAFVTFYVLLPLAIAVSPTEATFNLCIFATIVPLVLGVRGSEESSKINKEKTIFWNSVLLLAICSVLACVTALLWNMTFPPALIWLNQAAYPAVIALFFFYLYVIYRFVDSDNR